MVGLLTPSGIAGDKGASEFFKGVATSGRLACLFDFENRRPGRPRFFPDVDGRFKFCAFIAGGPQRSFPGARCGFFLDSAQQVEDPERTFTLSAQDFARINPNTGTAPVFRTQRAAEITRAIYERVPVLVDRRQSEPQAVWPLRYYTMFHMTNDSHLFRTASQLREQGCYRVAGNRWKRGEEEFVPLYEGKMVQAFDHRAASVMINPENVHRPAVPLAATLAQHADASWQPTPQFWVEQGYVKSVPGLEWVLGFKEITSPTNARTLIAAMLPYYAFGNKVPLLLPWLPTEPLEGSDIEPVESWVSMVSGLVDEYRGWAPLLLANLNSFMLDFTARQKIQGQTLNLFIVEQLPVLPASAYEASVGGATAAELVRREVLKLTYTSHDMQPLAQDMGYGGPPFAWDEGERRHARARLDALYFLLYGLDRDAAAYILDTFPIVRAQDTAAFGRYLTKELILGYMAAFEAGDVKSHVVDNLQPR
ncbi:MAG: restriction endonuclease, partial [Chloroflexota bacterium]